MSVLRAAPFNLQLGSLIEVQVIATNLKGASTPSELNTEGAIV
jgi:hypothetical protein